MLAAVLRVRKRAEVTAPDQRLFAIGDYPSRKGESPVVMFQTTGADGGYEPEISVPISGSTFSAPKMQSQRCTWAPVEMSDPRQ